MSELDAVCSCTPFLARAMKCKYIYILHAERFVQNDSGVTIAVKIECIKAIGKIYRGFRMFPKIWSVDGPIWALSSWGLFSRVKSSRNGWVWLNRSKSKELNKVQWSWMNDCQSWHVHNSFSALNLSPNVQSHLKFSDFVNHGSWMAACKPTTRAWPSEFKFWPKIFIFHHANWSCGLRISCLRWGCLD